MTYTMRKSGSSTPSTRLNVSKRKTFYRSVLLQIYGQQYHPTNQLQCMYAFYEIKRESFIFHAFLTDSNAYKDPKICTL